MICFENCQSVPYAHTGRVDRGWLALTLTLYE